MKTLKSAVLALGLLGAWGGPAAATSIDYTLAVPLLSSDAVGPLPDTSLSGTFSYDPETGLGLGIFDIDGISDAFTGNAWVLDLGNNALGVLFDATGTNDAGLYMNINTGAGMLGNVNYCPTGGCSFYTSMGGSMTSNVAAPSLAVSAVPLPPAVSLFGTALLALAGFGAGRRLRSLARAVVRA